MKINIKFCAINSKTHAHKDTQTNLAICEENHIINKGRAIKTNMATAREKVRLNRMMKMMWGSQMSREGGRGGRTGWLSCKTRTHSCYTCSYSSWKSLNINFAQQKVKPCGATKAIRLIGVVEGMSWRLFCRSREGGVAGGNSTLHVLRVLISHARIMSNAHLMLPPSRMWLVEGKQRKSEAYYPPYIYVCVSVFSRAFYALY